MRLLSNPLIAILPGGLFLICIAALIVVFPKESLDAAVFGVSVWWDVLFPALFPFFVVSELMLGFGIVHFAGTLLDPMMRPLFRVPGSGGFVMAMGFASGYPVAAKLTGQLWEAGLVNRKESERLIAFATTSDPIFLIGAVAVGFFHDASLALILAISHYGGAVLVGLLLRLRAKKVSTDTDASVGTGTHGHAVSSKQSIWLRAFYAMHRARLADGRPFGKLLIDGIQSGLRLMIVVGGLVIFFSVVIQVLTLADVIGIIQVGIGAMLSLFSIPAPLSAAVVNGFFEVTLGAKTAGQSFPGANLQAQVAVASFGLAWAGLSVHAQIMSLVSHMPVRYAPFAAARLIHGTISALIAFFAWDALAPFRTSAPAWLPAAGFSSGREALQTLLPVSAILFFGVFVMILVLFAAYRVIRIVFQVH